VDPGPDPKNDRQGLFTYAPVPWQTEISLWFYEHASLNLYYSAPGVQEVKCSGDSDDWKAETWHHVVATWSVSRKRVSIHVDGKRLVQRYVPDMKALDRSDTKLVLGNHTPPRDSPKNGLDGDVRSVAVFGRALDDEDIKALDAAARR
jgi:hypothetical protein